MKDYESGALDFSQVKTVHLDEYVSLLDNYDQSYAYLMRSHLFDHVNIEQANCNIPNGINLDVERTRARYDTVIDDLGGADIKLLCLGTNGHIDFNELRAVKDYFFGPIRSRTTGSILQLYSDYVLVAAEEPLLW